LWPDWGQSGENAAMKSRTARTVAANWDQNIPNAEANRTVKGTYHEKRPSLAEIGNRNRSRAVARNAVAAWRPPPSRGDERHRTEKGRDGRTLRQGAYQGADLRFCHDKGLAIGQPFSILPPRFAGFGCATAHNGAARACLFPGTGPIYHQL
jgi:hypothetical protein